MTCGIDRKKHKKTSKQTYLFDRELDIPPRREIWSSSDGSHSEKNYGWEIRREVESKSALSKKRVDLDL